MRSTLKRQKQRLIFCYILPNATLAPMQHHHTATFRAIRSSLDTSTTQQELANTKQSTESLKQSTRCDKCMQMFRSSRVMLSNCLRNLSGTTDYHLLIKHHHTKVQNSQSYEPPYTVIAHISKLSKNTQKILYRARPRTKIFHFVSKLFEAGDHWLHCRLSLNSTS